MNYKKILIIQTAYIGDVILATSLIEYIAQLLPNHQIDFLLRSGNESIITTHPNITNLYIWDKNQSKYLSLFKIIKQIRKEKYEAVLNIQRFFNSGLVTALSGAKMKVGFHSNPLSFLFTHKIIHKIPHKIDHEYYHEVQRNAQLLNPIIKNHHVPNKLDLRPKIYFNESDHSKIDSLNIQSPYIVIAPSSVWYTKQWHINKWKELINEIPSNYTVYLIGAPSDLHYTNQLELHENVINLTGKLSLRQSALLMQNASRVFVNDSAPLHLASAVNAKTTAIFCSTVKEFGYTPLSREHFILEDKTNLSCRPCGLHGHKQCPLKHFKCSENISSSDALQTIA